MSDVKGKNPHNRSAKHDDDDEDDPVDKMLKKAGCLEQHYKVQECMVEYSDWRQCKSVVKGNNIDLNRIWDVDFKIP